MEVFKFFSGSSSIDLNPIVKREFCVFFDKDWVETRLPLFPIVTYVSVFVPQQRGFSFKNGVVRRSKKPDSSRVRVVRKWLMSTDLGTGG